MFDCREIERTIKDNHLPFQKIEDADKEILTQRLYGTFVFGNPRALWLSFKYVLYSIDCNTENPYFHLLDIIDKSIVPYFFIDYQNEGFAIYKAEMSNIHKFIGDCEGPDEYYLATENSMELHSITDHDDLFYIDVKRNEMKKLITNEQAVLTVSYLPALLPTLGEQWGDYDLHHYPLIYLVLS